MEEDIKLIEEYIDFQKKWALPPRMKASLEAIENLLKRYKELEENNKELKKYYASRKEVEDLKETIACLHESGKEFIPISVIQNELDWYKGYVGTVLYEKYNYGDLISVLQKILEKGNK